MKKTLLSVLIAVFLYSVGWCLAEPFRILDTDLTWGPEIPTPVNYYVATSGSDSNTGTISQPFKTLEAARDKIRSISVPTGGVTVWIRGGTYPRTSSFQLISSDSGSSTKPIIYRAYPGETVKITGGKTIDPSNFNPVTNSTTLSRIHPSATDQVVELDLQANGIQHINTYPNVFGDDGGIIELFFNDQRMPISRWPNGDELFTTMNGVIWNGRYQYNCDIVGDGVGKFHYKPSDDGPARWTQTTIDHGLWTKGYWRVAWQNEAVKVADIDHDGNWIRHTSSIGLGIGDKYRRQACVPEGSYAERWWVFNVLEEIDTPGEWALDFLDKKLYFWPTDNLSNGNIVINDTDAPLVTLTDTNYVKFIAIVFENGLDKAVSITNGNSNSLDGCVIRNFSGDGVYINGGFLNGLQSCDIYNMGAGGVFIDRTSTSITQHYVKNCYIHDYAELTRVYAGAIDTRAYGSIIANNKIHTTPHVGVEWECQESIFEYNEVYDICRMSTDMGAFYQYAKITADGGYNTFRYNFMHSSLRPNEGKGGADGIYIDQRLTDGQPDTIIGNIGYNMRTVSLLKDVNPHFYENNIAVDCLSGHAVTADPSTRPFLNNIAYKATFSSNFDMNHNKLYTSDPGFKNIPNHDFTLYNFSKVFTDLPQFQNIPMHLIGLHSDDYRKICPTLPSTADITDDGITNLPDFKEIACQWEDCFSLTDLAYISQNWLTSRAFNGAPATIPGVIEAEDYDISNPEHFASNDTTAGNLGDADYRPLDDVDIANCAEGGYNIGWIDTGEWLNYTVSIQTAGLYDITFRVASESAGGTLTLLCDGVDITGQVTFGPTGGWQIYTDATAQNVTLPAGTHTLTLYMNTDMWNINNVIFTESGQ